MNEKTRRRPLSAGLLLGFGSIGKFHARNLADRYGQLTIVDQDPRAREGAQEVAPGVRVAASLDDVSDVDWSHTLAVIATWGPSHTALFEQLVDREIGAVLCEKPLATSVADAVKMVELSRRAQVPLGVHLHRRYSGFIEGLRELEERFALGSPQSLVIHGGARCLVTNGYHYLDFACALFGAPVQVISTATEARINPRSPDLGFYGGTAVWSFAEGREFTLAFTNESSVLEQVHLYYRDANVSIRDADEIVRVRRRPTEEVERDPRITRVGNATDLLYEGLVPGYRTAPEPTLRMIEELEGGGDQVLRPEAAIDVTGALIAALTAGRDRVVISLPLDADHEMSHEHWPIS